MIVSDSEVFPENPRLWYFRYERMLHKENPIMAWAEAANGLRHLPEDCQLYFGLAVASYDLGDTPGAIHFLKLSEKYMMLTERKNMEALIAVFRERIRLSEKKGGEDDGRISKPQGKNVN